MTVIGGRASLRRAACDFGSMSRSLALDGTAAEAICRAAFPAADRAAQRVGFCASASGETLTLLGEGLEGWWARAPLRGLLLPDVLAPECWAEVGHTALAVGWGWLVLLVLTLVGNTPPASAQFRLSCPTSHHDSFGLFLCGVLGSGGLARPHQLPGQGTL